MNLGQLGKALIMIAIIIGIIGLFMLVVGRGLGIQKLPGDIMVKRDNWGLFFPIVTSIIGSILLTLIVNIVLWFFRR